MNRMLLAAVALATATCAPFAIAADAAKAPAHPTPDMGSMHAGFATSTDVGDVKVAKATGPNARTVAEIVSKRTDLKDKTVLVRGKVVKFTPAVMGKNWVHLRDGSGTPGDRTNDIVVTTADETSVGAVVLVKGTVRTDVQLGSGYAYNVMVDGATLQK